MKLFHHKSTSLHLRGLVIALGASVLIAACGGGGGGGGSTGGGGGVPNGVQGAQLLETTDGNASNAHVAINAAGVGYAVWLQVDVTSNLTHVMSSRYSNGAWEAAQLVSAEVFVAAGADTPKVFVHPDGRATAVWAQQSPGGRNIVGSTTDASGKWSAFGLIQAGNGVDLPADLDLVSDNQGNGTVVWRVGDTLFASAFRGTDFQAPEQISLGVDRQAKSPRVVMRTDVPGQALVAWEENDANDNNHPKVFVRAFDGNDWLDAIALSGSNADPDGISAAMGADGKAVVTWKQIEGADNFLMVRTSLNVFSGQWGPSLNLLEGNLNDPHAAMDGQGRAVVVYSLSNGAQFDLFARRFNGANFGAPLKLETEDQGDASLVRLAMDASGRVFAVWQQGNGNRTDVMANRMDPTTGAWGTAERIETEDRGSAFSPSLAVNAGGRAMAVWAQRNGATDAAGTEINSVMGNVFK